MNKNFSNQLYSQLSQKLLEVSSPSPQELGMLTSWYKKTTHCLKISPWKIFLPLALFLSLVFHSFLGMISIRLVSVLQAAF